MAANFAQLLRSTRALTLAALTLLALLAAAPAPNLRADSDWDRKSRLLREEGSIYLEDFIPRGEKLLVPPAAGAQIFYKPDFERYLGTLRNGQKVEVVAVMRGGKAFRVRGKAQQGDVVGWVPPSALPDMPKELVEDIIKAGERHATVQKLIEEKAVAIGMTEGEVEQSLGKPERLSSKVTGGEAATAQWHFITYDTIPQQVTGYDRFGRLVTSTQYVKVPSGKLTVGFREGVVEEIEKSEGVDEAAIGTVRIVQRPIILRY